LASTATIRSAPTSSRTIRIPPDVVVDVRSHLELEPRPAIGQCLATQSPDLVVVVAQPANRGGVRGIAVASELGLASGA
jgi:hypothetical protein